jgi:regulatory protein
MTVAGRQRRELQKRGSPKSCHERALGLLAVRMRSRRELADRLGRAGFEDEEVRDVLERLQRVGLVDDERFAEELARHAATVKRSGDRAIASALYAKGVARDTIDRVVADVGADEDSRAQELARSQVSRLRGLPREKAFQRLAGLLMRRGYAPTLARSAARSALEIEGLEE